jgi:hypothetical protein
MKRPDSWASAPEVFCGIPPLIRNLVNTPKASISPHPLDRKANIFVRKFPVHPFQIGKIDI